MAVKTKNRPKCAGCGHVPTDRFIRMQARSKVSKCLAAYIRAKSPNAAFSRYSLLCALCTRKAESSLKFLDSLMGGVPGCSSSKKRRLSERRARHEAKSRKDRRDSGLALSETSSRENDRRMSQFDSDSDDDAGRAPADQEMEDSDFSEESESSAESSDETGETSDGTDDDEAEGSGDQSSDEDEEANEGTSGLSSDTEDPRADEAEEEMDIICEDNDSSEKTDSREDLSGGQRDVESVPIERHYSPSGWESYRPFHCEECSFSFYTEHDLRCHVEKAHNEWVKELFQTFNWIRVGSYERTSVPAASEARISEWLQPSVQLERLDVEKLKEMGIKTDYSALGDTVPDLLMAKGVHPGDPILQDGLALKLWEMGYGEEVPSEPIQRSSVEVSAAVPQNVESDGFLPSSSVASKKPVNVQQQRTAPLKFHPGFKCACCSDVLLSQEARFYHVVERHGKACVCCGGEFRSCDGKQDAEPGACYICRETVPHLGAHRLFFHPVRFCFHCEQPFPLDDDDRWLAHQSQCRH